MSLEYYEKMWYKTLVKRFFQKKIFQQHFLAAKEKSFILLILVVLRSFFLTKCYGLRKSNDLKKVSRIVVQRSLANWLGR